MILSAMKMEATRSSETSFLAKPTRRRIQEDGILDAENFLITWVSTADARSRGMELVIWLAGWLLN
jgi:hypothetical protein